MVNHHRFRVLAAGLFLIFALALAPAAFARHYGYSIGVSGPGYSVGYSDCHHCGYHHDHGYVSVGLYDSYAPVYYGPAYYDYPSTYVVYERPCRTRYYERDRYYHRHHRYYDGYRW